jgi:GH24 family phage-related lysozyme (muramidase)
MEMDVSPPAIVIIKELETLQLEAYEDGASVSIGYGHSNLSGGEQFDMGDVITEDKAEQLLKEDLKEIVRIVNQRLKNYNLTFTQEQFDTMVIATFNRPSKVSSKKFYDALLLDDEDKIQEVWETSLTEQDRKNFPGLVERLEIELAMLDQDRGIPEPEEGFDPSPIQDVNPSNMQDQVRAGNVRDVNPSNMQDQVRAGNVRDVNPSNMQDQVRAGNVISNIWSQGVDFTNAVAKSESQVVALIQAAINNQRRAKNLPDISNDMSMDRKRETLSDDQKVALDILRGLYGK